METNNNNTPNNPNIDNNPSNSNNPNNGNSDNTQSTHELTAKQLKRQRIRQPHWCGHFGVGHCQDSVYVSRL